MREQGHGHIIQVSSVLGIVTLPLLGIYNASKWAVEGISESLAQEVKQFGISISLIEPNGYSTDWSGASAVQSQPIEIYNKTREELTASSSKEGFVGDPEATTEAVLKLVDAENPPLRLFLGKITFPWVKEVYANRISEWEAWNDVAIAAHGNY